MGQRGSYARHIGLPFGMYGETIFVFLQNGVMACLHWRHNKQIRTVEKLVLCQFIVIYFGVLIADTLLSEGAWKAIASTTICFSLGSKWPQIIMNY